MTTKFTLSVLLLLISFGALSQVSRKVEGRIQAADQTPLIGMTVQLLPEKKTTFTNEQGEFRFIDIPDGTYRLVVSGVGFEAKSVDLQVSFSEGGQLYP